MSTSTKEGTVCPVKTTDGIIGVQGEQGSDEHYYWSTGCTGITHTVETQNTTNIYNYMACTGCCVGTIGPKGPTGATGGVIVAPTQTYLSAAFDHYRVGYQLTVTTTGLTVPYRTDLRNKIQPIINTSGSDVQFQIRENGIYEICYQIYLKEAAQVGSRIRRNTNIVTSSVMDADSMTAHLSAVSLVRCYENDLISVELFTEADVEITLKGIIGASITIKRLAS